MSLGRPEKICPHEKARPWKRFEKRRISRLRRLAERKDPENAPTKGRFLGYSV